MQNRGNLENSPPNGMGYPQIVPSATTSTAGVEYKLTFI